MALLVTLTGCSLASNEPASGASAAPRATDLANGTAPAPVSVSVSTDRARYQAGERILVTISNRLGVSVFAPSRGGCSIVGLRLLEAAEWISVDTCPAFEVYVTEIAPMSDLTGALGPASQAPTASGPIVIGPISPGSSGDDLTNLPTVAPWRSGDPIRVVPEGAIAPPFSATVHDLGPGTYRVEFSFARGSASGPVGTVYSEPFVVAN